MPNSARTNLLNAVATFRPTILEEADRLDEHSKYPHAEFERLTGIGLLTATIPESHGGLGFGFGREGALDLLRLFVLLGRGNLAIARLYEAHVNALQLIFRYGSSALAEVAAQDAALGHIFALWVTDPPAAPLVLKRNGSNLVLEGGKVFCSGAGVATRALITALTDFGTGMLLISLDPNTRVTQSPIKLSGMRAAITGSIDFSGMTVRQDALLGDNGDYLREPVFSAGAWRGSAGALGGLSALVDLHREELLARNRDTDPHQRARFGQVVMAYETAALWMREAALRGCLEDAPAENIVAYINLARLAVEAACLDAMRLTQRSLGLGAFIAHRPVERICRDLSTYLRQPAPDEALEKAAQYYFHAPLPGEA